ncbi:tubulin-specific chaperone A isoform X2 [Narcine bancroftii]
MYEKEAKQQEEKVERMKVEGNDQYMVKKQRLVKNWGLMKGNHEKGESEGEKVACVNIEMNKIGEKESEEFLYKWNEMEVLQESWMMIPDCQRRLATAHNDLAQMLESEKDLEETEEYKEAQATIGSIKLEA